jgi:hypothetical protein
VTVCIHCYTVVLELKDYSLCVPKCRQWHNLRFKRPLWHRQWNGSSLHSDTKTASTEWKHTSPMNKTSKAFQCPEVLLTAFRKAQVVLVLEFLGHVATVLAAHCWRTLVIWRESSERNAFSAHITTPTTKHPVLQRNSCSSIAAYVLLTHHTAGPCDSHLFCPRKKTLEAGEVKAVDTDTEP